MCLRIALTSGGGSQERSLADRTRVPPRRPPGREPTARRLGAQVTLFDPALNILRLPTSAVLMNFVVSYALPLFVCRSTDNCMWMLHKKDYKGAGRILYDVLMWNCDALVSQKEKIFL